MSVYCDDDDKSSTFSLPFYLMLLMSKVRDKVFFRSDFATPVIVNMLYDLVTEAIMQFGLFLSYHYADNFATYGQLLPDNALKAMAHFKVCPEIAYKVFRPSVKPLYKMEEREWADLVLLIRNSFEDFAVERSPEPRAEESDCGAIAAYIAADRNKIWEYISPEVYTAFWVLEPEYIFVPVEA